MEHTLCDSCHVARVERTKKPKPKKKHIFHTVTFQEPQKPEGRGKKFPRVHFLSFVTFVWENRVSSRIPNCLRYNHTPRQCAPENQRQCLGFRLTRCCYQTPHPLTRKIRSIDNLGPGTAYISIFIWDIGISHMVVLVGQLDALKSIATGTMCSLCISKQQMDIYVWYSFLKGTPLFCIPPHVSMNRHDTLTDTPVPL